MTQNLAIVRMTIRSIEQQMNGKVRVHLTQSFVRSSDRPPGARVIACDATITISDPNGLVTMRPGEDVLLDLREASD